MRKTILIIIALAVSTWLITLAAKPAAPAAAIHSSIPPKAMVPTILNSTHRHREWINVAAGSTGIRTFVVYPERADKAPAILLAETKQGASNWIRAVGDQLASEGYIAVVPDLLSGLGPRGGDSDSFPTDATIARELANMDPHEIVRRNEAVRQWAIALPSSDGSSASLELTPLDDRTRIDVLVSKKRTVFQSNGHEWPEMIQFLNTQFENRPVAGANTNVPEDHSAHMLMAQAAEQRGPQRGTEQLPSGRGRGGPLGYPMGKLPELPAGLFTARSTLNHSMLRKEWVDIPVGDVKLHMWVEYPDGNAKAPFVLVMQQAPGLDEWQRGIADQLALQGFIAVAPDLYSGLGPNGGNYDSFEGVDAAMRAMAKLTPDETLRRYKAAYAWGMSQPRASGKSATLGFCAGGGVSFNFAGEVPGINAAVVFYGGPASDANMAKIKAPVISFSGENDERVTASMVSAADKMKSLGKSFEYHVYPRATHAFIMFQDMGGNGPATADSWPRAIAFLNQNLK
jgi:carboxymethylenebutenolidase